MGVSIGLNKAEVKSLDAIEGKIKSKIYPKLKNTANIYNHMTGKEVINENYGAQAKGTYNVSFDASNLEAGNYFYSLIANGQRLTKRMVVTK